MQLISAVKVSLFTTTKWTMIWLTTLGVHFIFSQRYDIYQTRLLFMSYFLQDLNYLFHWMIL